MSSEGYAQEHVLSNMMVKGMGRSALLTADSVSPHVGQDWV